MKVVHVVTLFAFLLTSTGCSRMVQVPRADLDGGNELRDVRVRTRTGESYYFERARVAADSLSGFAQESRTVFLEGGEVQEVVVSREVHVALAEVEQVRAKRRDWGRTALWALGAAGLAAIVAIAASSGGDDGGGGGGSGGGKGPPF